MRFDSPPELIAVTANTLGKVDLFDLILNDLLHKVMNENEKLGKAFYVHVRYRYKIYQYSEIMRQTEGGKIQRKHLPTFLYLSDIRFQNPICSSGFLHREKGEMSITESCQGFGKLVKRQGKHRILPKQREITGNFQILKIKDIATFAAEYLYTCISIYFFGQVSFA